ncbi:MAG: hypothetical protein EPO36_11660 [Chloroflexota bacterium]|nr:MAG: hypothetical protein EPO36_11660 [Chloroflexota bacterium]
MTHSTDFDRSLVSWLETGGPAAPDPEIIDAALEAARKHSQRRGLRAWLVGPAAWPALGPRRSFTHLAPAVRVALIGLLLLAGLASVVVGGGSFLDRLFAAPLVPTPVPTAHPFVLELPPATTAQISSSSAIRLADGRVLVVGGADTTVGQATIARAWLFDPATNEFVETGPMSAPRSEPLLALLADGRVLVVGGMNVDGSSEGVDGAELYDPASGTFRRTAGDPIARMNTPQGAMDHAWASPQITRLGDGRVLVSGGVGRNGATAVGLRADLYDPGTETFEELQIGCNALRGTQVLLADGRVLVTCLPDRTSDQLAAAVFDPASGTFAPTGAPSTRANDIGNLLPDGRVLFTGSTIDPGADLYDPTTGTFSTLEVRGRPDGNMAGLDIGRGRLLFLGFADPETPLPTLVFDTARLEFREIELPSLQLGEPTVVLADGRILQVHYQLAATLLDASQLP